MPLADVPPATSPRCPRCGREARPDDPAGLCPACLQVVASETASDPSGDAVTMAPGGLGLAPGADARLVPGQAFGPYRVVRLLGRGGMGEVYEVEQREQGRRVALKVLNQRLTDPHDRARFLREGQLAASISHPNSVYIFGSEDIAGTPVIAMELLAGGTLKDRVHDQGPLAPAAAVDAILQVVAGLDAAYAGGILHRDVKPANCFTDRDGAVKVGDFGLSIPTQARDVTMLTRTGAFQGTPQFAPPERLKGVPQDVRADIYAVGATLYYLLTGQPPFDDADLMALVAQISTETPRSPRDIVRAVPRGLSAIVMRCLAKDRGSRPASYAVLEQALRPFGSVAPTPGTLGLRFIAGAIDQTIWSIPLLSWNMTWAFRSPTSFRWWQTAIGAATIVAYYGISEGLWGASIGKRLAGLRVTRADGQPPGMGRALWRAMVFQTPSLIGVLSILLIGEARLMELVRTTPLGPAASALLVWVPFGLLFSTVRQRNGFAAVHELASGTRVVRRLERNARPVLDAIRDPAPVAGTGPQRYGPYSVAGTLGRTDMGELLVGFDPNLRRPVWIHTLPPGTPAVAPLVRDLSRPGRLRWLSGGRSNGDAWDAYEALEGVPLASLLGAPRPWRSVRPWLPDLAREIDAGLKDGSVAALTIEHVWITRDGYAKLLDFCAPGVQPAAHLEEPATVESGQTFLASVAERALDRWSDDEPTATAAHSRDQPTRPSTRAGAPGSAHPAREPLPLSASATLETLARRGFATWSEVVARTTALLQGPDRISRWRRVAPLALCVLVPAIAALGFLLMMRLMSQVLTPEVTGLNNGLLRLSSLEQNGSRERAQERAALEVYIADRFRPMIADPQTWTNPVTAAVFGPRRALAERVVAGHPSVSRDELATATAALSPFIEEQERTAHFMKDSQTPAALFGFASLLTVVALLGIVWAFPLRGGLLFRACGVAVVTRDGKPASRLRALWRGLVAWALVPAAFWLALTGGLMLRGLTDVRGLVAIGLGLLFLLGVVWALVQPTRGLQDRLAGTRLVPR